VYGFDKHKGYPVPAHFAAIAKHGPWCVLLYLMQLQPLCTVLSLTRRAPRACLAQRHPPHDVRPHEAHEKMRGHMVIVGAFCIVTTIAPVTIIA
jgi:hypothetical protein